MNLGHLIETLEALPPKAPIRFDSGIRPGLLMSWRGRYAELTLTHADDEDADPTVGSVLKDARAAVGKTFEGYKGGDFKMDEGSPVWGDDWGRYTSLGIFGVAMVDGVAVIATADLSDYA